MKKLEDYVISIPDFPSPGIIFRDVTSILQDGEGLHLAIDQLLEMVKDVDFDVIVGAESRGFIFGMPVAYELHKPFILARKRESCRGRRFLWIMSWNTAQGPSRCTQIPLNPARRWSSSTI